MSIWILVHISTENYGVFYRQEDLDRWDGVSLEMPACCPDNLRPPSCLHGPVHGFEYAHANGDVGAACWHLT